jgi:putative NADH-flavin reductase
LYPEKPPLRPDEMTSLCILGITGGLGSQIAKDALQTGRHRVMGIVRSLEKASRVFSLDELRNIQLVQGSIGNDTATNDEAFLKNTFDLFKPDILVETIGNSARPHGIDRLMLAAARSKIETVVVTGGAGQLFTDPSNLDKYGPRHGINGTVPHWLVDVTNLHMDVQRRAFKFAKNFQIPTVFQITPPLMKPGRSTGNYQITYDIYNENIPSTVTYGDMSQILLSALQDPNSHNLRMVAVGAVRKRDNSQHSSKTRKISSHGKIHTTNHASQNVAKSSSSNHPPKTCSTPGCM